MSDFLLSVNICLTIRNALRIIPSVNVLYEEGRDETRKKFSCYNIVYVSLAFLH